MHIEPIAIVKGCYPEKFGIPRQSGIVTAAQAEIELIAPYQSGDFLDGLNNYSHVWLLFGFHQNTWQGDAKVRPQRLGGNQKMGVFATRSPYRPNGLGLSAVQLLHVDYDRVSLSVAGHDLVNGTPIFDIKPYIPFTDCIQTATSSFADERPQQFAVSIADSADMAFNLLSEDVQELICSMIAQNPLPPYHQDVSRVYGVAVLDLNVRFQRWNQGFQILSIHRNFQN